MFGFLKKWKIKKLEWLSREVIQRHKSRLGRISIDFSLEENYTDDFHPFTATTHYSTKYMIGFGPLVPVETYNGCEDITINLANIYSKAEMYEITPELFLQHVLGHILFCVQNNEDPTRKMLVIQQ